MIASAVGLKGVMKHTMFKIRKERIVMSILLGMVVRAFNCCSLEVEAEAGSSL